MYGLMLHSGGVGMNRLELAAVPTPKPTETWFPIPHERLVAQVSTALTGAGYSITEEAFGVTRDGLRMFGVMQLLHTAHADKEYGLIAGIRNSHDKSFPAALLLGSCVFVCDNLAFSGEVRLARKHTRFIMRDLPGVVAKGMDALTNLRGLQTQRIDAYRGHELTNSAMNDILISAAERQALPWMEIPNVLKDWREPRHEAFKARNAWSAFNCFTEAYKESSPELVARRSQRLHGLFDGIVGLKRAVGTDHAVAMN